MKPRDKGIPLDEVIADFNRAGYGLSRPLLTEWEKAFPMLKPIKHEILNLIVELVKVRGCSLSYAQAALKNSKSVFLQKRRAIAHLELIKKQLEDWRESL
jgi:hypothetical protein